MAVTPIVGNLCPVGARAHEPCQWTEPVGQGLRARAHEPDPWTGPMSLGPGQGPAWARYQALQSSRWIPQANAVTQVRVLGQ